MRIRLFKNRLTGLTHIIHRAMASGHLEAAEKSAFVNYTEERDRLQLTFKYASDDLPERQYNFSRSSAEELGSVLARIALNIKSRKEKKTKRKKKQETNGDIMPESELDVNVRLEYDGSLVPEDTANDAAWKDGAILQIGKQRYSVAVNAPTVRSARLPKVIMADFPVYPQLELENAHLNDCKVDWYKSVSRGQHFPASEVRRINNMVFYNMHSPGTSFTPTNADIGRHLLFRIAPFAGPRQGMPVEVVSTTAVEAGPGCRPLDVRQCFTDCLTGPGKLVALRDILWRKLAQ